MCVWQSQAPAGTAKVTGVAGWDAVARLVRGRRMRPVASAPTRSVRRVSMGCLLCMTSVVVAVGYQGVAGHALGSGAGQGTPACGWSRALRDRIIAEKRLETRDACRRWPWRSHSRLPDARLGLPCPPRVCRAVGLSRPACRAALRDLGALAPHRLNTYRAVQACRSAHMRGGHLSRHRVLVVGRDVVRDLPACVTQNSPAKWQSDP